MRQALGSDCVLLCWEAPGVRCHRRIVADWLGGPPLVHEYGCLPQAIRAFSESPAKNAVETVGCDHCGKGNPLVTYQQSAVCIYCGQTFSVEWED
jgi:hypothetical protein